MSLMDRIVACNTGDTGLYVPFCVQEHRIGWLKPDFAALLADFGSTFVRGASGRVRLHDALDDFETRSEAVGSVLRQLHKDGVIGRLHGEQYPVTLSWGAPPVMRIDRACAPYFGIRSWGVHLNGFVRKGADVPYMWIARRALDKPNYPGALDNMVAGGQPIGLGLRENLLKECAEEAAIPGHLAKTAHAAGSVSYRQETREGLKPDVMFCFDLELGEDFTPRNTDGEVADFMLLPIEQVFEKVANSTEFKPNSALVIIDFFVRHGIIDADNTSAYCDIVANLRR